MNKSAFTFLLLMLTAPPHAGAQEAPPAPPPLGPERMRPREWPPEQREQWREERRQRREQWRQMSPEDRHQLRRDVREAGRSLYPPQAPRPSHRPD